MPQKIVVGYDGSSSADRALDFAVDRAKAQGGSVLIVYVLEWSPYSFLTMDEIAERHTRRKQEIERAQTAIVDPARDRVSGAGVTVDAMVKYGHSSEILIATAQEEGASQIVIGRTGETGLTARLFGSVAGTLAQAAPVPVTIVP